MFFILLAPVAHSIRVAGSFFERHSLTIPNVLVGPASSLVYFLIESICHIMVNSPHLNATNTKPLNIDIATLVDITETFVPVPYI